MIDERYDRSADMRLLDLHREALGVPQRLIGSTSYIDPDALADVSKDEDQAYVQSGTILVASISAQPRRLLIPGALVTVSFNVSSDGDLAAFGVRLNLALPAGIAYRPGTLSIDATMGSDADAQHLFDNGAELGVIEPGSRRTLIIKLLVEPGLTDIILSPHLSATSGAIIGLRAIRLTRGAIARPQIVVERPFYESDAAEHVLEPLAPAPLVTKLEPQLRNQVLPAPRAVSDQPAIAKAKPRRAKAKARLAAQAPQAIRATQDSSVLPKIEIVRSVDDRIDIAGQGGPILTVRINQKRLATLTGLFSGASLGMIAHYLLLNALAAKDALPGDDMDISISAFINNQEQLLSRALIATRLGKMPTANSIAATLPPFPPALTAHIDCCKIDTSPAGEIVIARAFQTSEVLFLQRTLSNETAAPFLRAARLFIGLCANEIIVHDEHERRQAKIALTAYAALATAQISRVFLRASLNRAPVVFKATDAAFDNAARTVLAVLGRSI